MPANTAHSLPYPLGTDPVADGDNAIKNLAEALDPAPVDLVAGGLVPASGWTIQSGKAVRMGPLVFLQVNVTRTGADITAGSGGNMSPDVPVATGVPAVFRPATQQIGTISRLGVQTGWATNNSAGALTFTDGLPGVTYATASAYTLNFVYMLGV